MRKCYINTLQLVILRYTEAEYYWCSVLFGHFIPAAASLLVSLVPSQHFRQGYRSTKMCSSHHCREPLTLPPEALNTLHLVWIYPLNSVHKQIMVLAFLMINFSCTNFLKCRYICDYSVCWNRLSTTLSPQRMGHLNWRPILPFWRILPYPKPKG